MRAQGFANLFGGACGGLPVALSDSRTLIAWRAGARGRGAAVGHALCLLAAGTLLAPLISGLPLAVLAGLLVGMWLTAGGRRIRVALNIVPDEDGATASLLAEDDFGEELGRAPVSPTFRLDVNSALAWVQAGFVKPR